MADTTTAARSGSAQMLEQRFGKHTQLSQDQINQILGALKEKDLEVLHVLTKGIPAVDTVSGTVRVKPEALAGLISKLVSVNSLGIEIFPFGIINPEVLVNFRTLEGITNGGSR